MSTPAHDAAFIDDQYKIKMIKEFLQAFYLINSTDLEKYSKAISTNVPQREELAVEQSERSNLAIKKSTSHYNFFVTEKCFINLWAQTFQLARFASEGNYNVSVGKIKIDQRPSNDPNIFSCFFIAISRKPTAFKAKFILYLKGSIINVGVCEKKRAYVINL